MFIKCTSKEDRIKLIEFLEAEGFCCVENRSYSREKTIESRLPLVVDPNRKSISHMGSVTCAAAAAQSGVIRGEKEFYMLYSFYRMKRKKGRQLQSD